MPTTNMPAAEVEIDEDRIRRLLRAQHPDLADRPLQIVANGWDNVLARLGDDLMVRLPRRAVAAELVENEQRWLPLLAPHLPLPVPAPVRNGVASDEYPWSWSICSWIEGENAAAAPPRDTEAAALRLAAFLRALNRPAPSEAPINAAHRGGPLTRRDTFVERYLGILGTTIDQATVRRRWNAAKALEPYAGPPLWVHGDLHPANVIVRDGAIAAVVDFGDITQGDAATDVAIAWMMFEPAARRRFRDALGDVDAVAWERAAGNALALALAVLANSADNPIMRGVGQRTLAAILSDDVLRA